jgi:hypothetical protein
MNSDVGAETSPLDEEEKEDEKEEGATLPHADENNKPLGPLTRELMN